MSRMAIGDGNDWCWSLDQSMSIFYSGLSNEDYH